MPSTKERSKSKNATTKTTSISRNSSSGSRRKNTSRLDSTEGASGAHEEVSGRSSQPAHLQPIRSSDVSAAIASSLRVEDVKQPRRSQSLDFVPSTPHPNSESMSMCSTSLHSKQTLETIDTAPNARSGAREHSGDLSSAKRSSHGVRTPSSSKARTLSLTIGTSSALSGSRNVVDSGAHQRNTSAKGMASMSSFGTATSHSVLPDLVSLERALQDRPSEEVQETIDRIFKQRPNNTTMEDAPLRSNSNGHIRDRNSGSASRLYTVDIESELDTFQNTPIAWKTPFEVDRPRGPLPNNLQSSDHNAPLSPLLSRSNFTEEQSAWAGIDDLLENRSVDDSYALSTSDVLPKAIARALKRSGSKSSIGTQSIGMESVASAESEQDLYSAKASTRNLGLPQKSKSMLPTIRDGDEGDAKRSTTNIRSMGGNRCGARPKSTGTLFEVFQWSRKKNVDETTLKKKMKKLNQSPHQKKVKKKATFAFDDNTANSLPSLDSFRDDDLVSKSGLNSYAGKVSTASSTWTDSEQTAEEKSKANNVVNGGTGGVVKKDDGRRSTSEDETIDSPSPSYSEEDEYGLNDERNIEGDVHDYDDEDDDGEDSFEEDDDFDEDDESSDDEEDDDNTSAEDTEDRESGETPSRNPAMSRYPSTPDSTPYGGASPGTSTSLGNDGLVLDEGVDTYIKSIQGQIEVPEIGEDGTPLPSKRQRKKVGTAPSQSSPSPTSVADDEGIDKLPTLSSLSQKVKKPKKTKKKKSGKKKKQKKGGPRIEEKKEPKVSLAMQLKKSLRHFGGKKGLVGSKKSSSSVASGNDSKYFPKGTVVPSSRRESNKCLLREEDDGTNWS